MHNNACAAATNPDFSSLDVNRFDDAFDFLSLKGLVAVAETSKHLEHVVGAIFHRNYAAIDKLDGADENIYMYAGDNVHIFDKYINRIVFGADDVGKYFRKNVSKFQRLKRMTFSKMVVSNKIINTIKPSLYKLEFLRINGSDIEGDFYDKFLMFCPNLKRLSIRENPWNFAGDRRTGWLLEYYPLLENFELETENNRTLNELGTFFMLNPTIRKFSISAQMLWMNRQLIATNTTFDDLSILIDYEDHYENFGPFCNLVNNLYEQGFYKRLHVYFRNWDGNQQFYNKLTSLKALVKLYVGSLENPIKLPTLHNVYELCIIRNEDVSNLDALNGCFPNLKRLQIYNATSDELLMFIGQMAKLERIKVDYLDAVLDDHGFYDAYRDIEPKIIDLEKLNGIRQNVAGASNVTLYVRENFYLGTKSALQTTKMGKVEIKRGESFEWDNSFFHATM